MTLRLQINKQTITKFLVVVAVLIGIYGTYWLKHNREVIIDYNTTLFVKEVDWQSLGNDAKPTLVMVGLQGCQVCNETLPDLVRFWEDYQETDIRYIHIHNLNTQSIKPEIRITPSFLLFDSTGKPFQPTKVMKLPVRYVRDENNILLYSIVEGKLSRGDLEYLLNAIGGK